MSRNTHPDDHRSCYQCNDCCLEKEALKAQVEEQKGEIERLKRVCEYEHIPRFKCPDCGGSSYHDDHDDMSAHRPSGEDGTEPECVTCPVPRCDNCQAIMIDTIESQLATQTERVERFVKVLTNIPCNCNWLPNPPQHSEVCSAVIARKAIHESLGDGGKGE